MPANSRTVLTLAALLSTASVGCLGLDADGEFDSRLGCEDDFDHDGNADGGQGSGSGHDGDCERDLGQPNDDGNDGNDDSDDDGCRRGGDEGGDDGCDPEPEPEPEPGEEGGVCEAHVTDLIAGQHTDTGSITVSNDADEVTIAVDAAAPYLLAEVHIYIGTDEVPTNKSGNPAPGQFPYVVELVEPTANYELSVSLDELAVGCDDQLNVAVHAVVVSFNDQGEEVFEETAWGFGDEEFDGKRWGWSFDYGICCELPPEDGEGCTLTRGYWQTHNAEAEVPALQQSWPIAEGTQLCGQSWLDILHTSPNGDAFVILASQWIAASLNIESGASTTPEVDAAMASAADYLDACGIADADRDAALAVSDLLDAYNNGDVGPGHCE